MDKKSGWDVDADAAAAAFANENNDQNSRHVSEEEENSDGSAVHNETENVVMVVSADLPAQRSSSSSGRMLPGSTTYSERRMPVLANLLYGLFTLALGVTGYFLPLNLFDCFGFGGSSGPYAPSSSGNWSTDISTLPSDVRAWASSSQPLELSYATFVYISGAGAEQNFTLFQGRDNANGYHSQTLWSAATIGREPFNFPHIQNPSQFILTGTGWACFTGIDATPNSNGSNQQYYPQPKSSLVGCSNGTVVRTTDPTQHQHSFQGPYDFFIDNNTLWFKDYPPWSGDQAGSGILIYSIDNYARMEVELHSTYTKSKLKQYYAEGAPSTLLSYEDEAVNNDEDGICWAKHFALAIFVSAVPVTLASIALWLKRKAPAMAITSYIGISACAIFVYLAIAQRGNDMNVFWRWWLSISAALYLAILCDLTHCKRGIARSPLIWGINVSAIAFFIGMIILTGVFESPMAWPWILFNVFALIPLVIVGIGYSQVFLLALCAVGWLMTAVKIASALDDLAPPAANVPIYFVVLAASGLLIAGAGWWLNKNQDEFGSVICYHMERISLSRRLLPDEELDESARRGQGDAEFQGEVSQSA